MMHSLIVSADTRAVSSLQSPPGQETRQQCLIMRLIYLTIGKNIFIQLVKIFLSFIISAEGWEETSDGQYHGSILSGNFAGKLGNLGSRLRATEQRCQQHSTIYVCKIRKNTESKKA